MNYFVIMGCSSKRYRFEKVASNRVQRVLSTFELLKNCANKNNYEYTEADVEKMFSEMAKALRETKSVYLNELNKTNKSGFSF